MPTVPKNLPDSILTDAQVFQLTGQHIRSPGSSNINTTIDSSLLNPGNTIPALPGQQLGTSAGAFVAGGIQPLQPTIPGYVPQLSTNVGTLEQGQNMLRNKLGGLQSQLLNRGNEQQQLETQSGIPQFNQELSALNTDYANKQAQFMRQAENYRSGQVTGQENASRNIDRIERNKAIDLGGLGIQILAKQGNIDAAQKEVTRVLDYKYEPIKQEIDNTKEFIQMNYQDLSRADKIRADSLDRSLTREKMNLDKFQSQQKTYIDYLASQGKDASAAVKANSIEELNKITFDMSGADGLAAVTPNLSDGKPDVVAQLGNIIKFAGKDVPNAAKAIGVLASVQKIATANPEGRFIGTAPLHPFGQIRGAGARSERISNRADLAGIKSAVAIWVSGATLSEQQAKDVLKLVPDKNDTDFKIRTKLNNLSSFMQEQARAELAAKGISYTPVVVDYFSSPEDNYLNNAVNQALDPYTDYLKQFQL